MLVHRPVQGEIHQPVIHRDDACRHRGQHAAPPRYRRQPDPSGDRIQKGLDRRRAEGKLRGDALETGHDRLVMVDRLVQHGPHLSPLRQEKADARGGGAGVDRQDERFRHGQPSKLQDVLTVVQNATA